MVMFIWIRGQVRHMSALTGTNVELAMRMHTGMGSHKHRGCFMSLTELCWELMGAHTTRTRRASTCQIAMLFKLLKVSRMIQGLQGLQGLCKHQFPVDRRCSLTHPSGFRETQIVFCGMCYMARRRANDCGSWNGWPHRRVQRCLPPPRVAKVRRLPRGPLRGLMQLSHWVRVRGSLKLTMLQAWKPPCMVVGKHFTFCFLLIVFEWFTSNHLTAIFLHFLLPFQRQPSLSTEPVRSEPCFGPLGDVVISWGVSSTESRPKPDEHVRWP